MFAIDLFRQGLDSVFIRDILYHQSSPCVLTDASSIYQEIVRVVIPLSVVIHRVPRLVHRRVVSRILIVC